MAPRDDTFTERQQYVAQALISQMRAIKDENIELRKQRDILAADNDNQAGELKTLTAEIEVLRVRNGENEKLQEEVYKLQAARDDIQNLWKQNLEDIAQGLGIDLSTLLPEPESELPVFVPSSPVDSIISEHTPKQDTTPTGLEILEGLGCDRTGNIWNGEGRLLGKVLHGGKPKSLVTCYKRKLLCNRGGEFVYKGAVLLRAQLVDTEDHEAGDADEDWV
ncbi:hypothetical protein E2P81_ATG08315 [Venturia nashicola]|nr:hypothetical protein E2P81_ATG08315 [Venturia nashicola]